MFRPPAGYKNLAICFVAAVLTYSILATTAPTTKAAPMPPGPHDGESSLSKSMTSPQPVFPDWFGKGLRPLQPTLGEGRVVALLIDFPDRQANTVARPDSFYRDLFFSEGTHPVGSLRDFFLEQSFGAFDLTGEVHGWIRTAEDYYTTFDDGN